MSGVEPLGHGIEGSQNRSRIQLALESAAVVSDEREIADPIVPIGHRDGIYYLLSPAGELRSMRAEALESGRGVVALLSGVNSATDDWCRTNFPDQKTSWSPKRAGLWIIEACNRQGIFDPNSAELRSVGVWRDARQNAFVHCGQRLIYADGKTSPVNERHEGFLVVAGPAIDSPTPSQALKNGDLHIFLQDMRRAWGWKRDKDAEIVLGWIAMASLGGFPRKRPHLYVNGPRGSGKSTLLSIANSLLGDMSGSVITDATEAALRQSRNNQARPVLIDEFEPEADPRTAAKHNNLFFILRSMYDGVGAQIQRGGADHKSVGFRMTGAAYLTSINHIELPPQDRSRFAMIELGKHPVGSEAVNSLKCFQRVCAFTERNRNAVLNRMLSQSVRWDETVGALTQQAISLGADMRQADTAASIVAGLDCLLFDERIGAERLKDHGPHLSYLINDTAGVAECSAGHDVLDHLLTQIVYLDRGVRRSVRELINSAMDGEPYETAEHPARALSRHGIVLLQERRKLAVRTGSSASKEIFTGSAWQNGAHVSALLQLNGAQKPPNPVRLPFLGQGRVVLVPLEHVLDASNDQIPC